ncbi:hypothetical protein AX769_21405 (plasmid) [Frondihabitans sp. PAMC 28766]|uniref:universal stress protein n=1 Tax=Frondihabitans sp. PAMC 28766 TaxID=1795630 RepID=UPI00078D3ADF|nr:universal stress protein [Frondihabitans sp. PAMC 28766]AMM22684.1 hypothetical protein AX769_21405 [Frondihabitans sp. PAMC 28766]
MNRRQSNPTIQPESTDPKDGDLTLVAFDGSPTSVAALAWAATRCRGFSPETSRLELLLAVPAKRAHRRWEEERRAELATAAGDARASLPDTTVLADVVVGEIVESFSTRADSADLVVVGSGAEPRLVITSLAERLWARGVRSTVVVPSAAAHGDVLLIVTPNGVSARSADWASRQAILLGVGLRLVAVQDESVHRREHETFLQSILTDLAASLRSEKAVVQVSNCILRGEPVESFRHLSVGCSLVVLEDDPRQPHRGERLRRGLLLAVPAPTALLAPPRDFRPFTSRPGEASIDRDNMSPDPA